MATAAQTPRTTRDIVIVTAITAALLATFPLMALVGLALQFGFAIAAALLVVGLALSPVFLRVFARAGRGEEQVHGVRLPHGLYLHERHSWARETRAGRFQVGGDELLSRALPKVEAADLPELGQRIEQGGALVTLHEGDRTLVVKAPFTGTVTRVNDAVGAKPGLIQSSAYDEGWLLEMQPEGGARGLDGLRSSDTATPWLIHQIDRLLALSDGPAAAPAMADGGEVMQGYAAGLDDETWARIQDELF